MGDFVLHTFAFLGSAAIIVGVSWLAVRLRDEFLWQRDFLQRLDDRVSELEKK
jgi:hypothetical protein